MLFQPYEHRLPSLFGRLPFPLLFDHRTQCFEINNFLATDTFVNMLPNSDLGIDYLFIVRRLKVIDEPFDHLLFHYRGKHLCGLLTPPLGILTERFPTLLFCPLKNCAVRNYLDIELIIFQEGIGNFSPAGGLFQSHIPSDHGSSQAIREDLVEQMMISPIGCHLPIEHAQVGARISGAIIFDKLGCLELGRLNNLREIDQTV